MRARDNFAFVAKIIIEKEKRIRYSSQLGYILPSIQMATYHGISKTLLPKNTLSGLWRVRI
jgi:hypothetical protein